MDKFEKLSLMAKGGANHLLLNAPETIKDRFVRPTNISIMITRDCNLRCVMCGIPDEIYPHLDVDQWKTALDDIADWAGGYTKVQFSGGEPLIFKGIYEILEHCVKRKLLPGITTNGTVTNEEKSTRLMAMGLANINVSLDGYEDTHDKIRGFNAKYKPIKVWEKTDRGIRQFMKARTETGSKSIVLLKTCLMIDNAQDVRKLVEYTKEVGADGITFQPMTVRDVNGEGIDDHVTDCEKLSEATDQLIQMKLDGEPITNNLQHLSLFKNYFEDPLSGDYEGRQPCSIGHSSLEIHSDGRVQFCHDVGILGNVLDSPPSEIWKSKIAADHRAEIAHCTTGCLHTCYANKTLSDKARMFLKITK